LLVRAKLHRPGGLGPNFETINQNVVSMSF